ncbi:MAG: hypothetical protein ACYC9O_03300 [Candidatus Latescibacterota bacterium]
MVRFVKGVFLLVALLSISGGVWAQSVYDLRQLTQEQWLSMSTHERMSALSLANKQAVNQTFMGQFGQYYDDYRRWGYEFYEMEDRYENFSFRNFENYNIIEERRRRWSYNEFGDRIPRMRNTYTLWREYYNDDGTNYYQQPSSIDHYINSIATRGIDGVWVAKEATDDWAVSAVYAGALRTSYTPLTLNIPNIDGMRIDFQSANNQISILNSTLLGISGSGSEIVNKGGAMLRAGHFRRKLGALTLGATYANQYAVQGNRQGSDSWYGTLHNYTPSPMVLAVRVLDDSPEDGNGGPLVNDVRLKINGRYREDIKPQVIVDDVTRDRTSALIKEIDKTYVEPASSIKVGGTKYDFQALELNIPKYADYFYMNDVMKGQNTTNISKDFNVELGKQYYQVMEPGMPVRVNGTQYVVYLFDIASITEKVYRAEAELTVSNDYRVETAQIYTENTTGGHDNQGKPKSWYNATYWRTSAQAEGNIKDGSNIKRVRVDFGLQVASILYGFDADFNYRGFKVMGEFVTNSNHYMYPDAAPGTGFPEEIISGQTPRLGHRYSQQDNAYYLITQKDWKVFGFSGEVFKMGKNFRPYFDFFYPMAKDMSYGVNSINARNSIVRFPFMEDNDDDDQYPDTMIVQRAMGYRILSTEDPDGVFPGNDMDNDGIADNNKNNNDIPDYDEPFLMFDVDPDQFVFGNDFNNNGIPDFREDDMKMDTPYELDRKGSHFSFRVSPLPNVNLYLGSMRTRGVGLDNRTNDDYFKFNINYDVFDVGKVFAEYRRERIQDNIRDAYIQVGTNMSDDYLMPGITSTVGRFTREIYFDELEYQNSNVDRLFIDSRIRALPSVTLENHVKLERNSQQEGTMYNNVYQPSQDINTMAMVNKIVYTKSWGNWQFSPGIKFRFYKKDRSEAVRANEFYMYRIPMLMLKYIISPRTDIMFGMQGLPGMEFRYKDYVMDMNDFNQKTYTLQLQNRTTYFGYQIWAATGIRVDEKKFDQDLRSFEDFKSSTTFVKVFLGY